MQFLKMRINCIPTCLVDGEHYTTSYAQLYYLIILAILEMPLVCVFRMIRLVAR